MNLAECLALSFRHKDHEKEKEDDVKSAENPEDVAAHTFLYDISENDF